MSEQPFIGSDQRPDLTIDLDARVSDLTVRQLSAILGSAPAKLKELPQSAKEIKEPVKEGKEPKDIKDSKDHKDPKEHKDQKDTKDHKDPKDQKDQKDQKEPKDHKDQKDTKDQKDAKDTKEHKDQKDHKDPKEHKDEKDLKDRKEGLIEKIPGDKHPVDKVQEVAQTDNPGGGGVRRSTISCNEWLGSSRKSAELHPRAKRAASGEAAAGNNEHGRVRPRAKKGRRRVGQRWA